MNDQEDMDERLALDHDLAEAMERSRNLRDTLTNLIVRYDRFEDDPEQFAAQARQVVEVAYYDLVEIEGALQRAIDALDVEGSMYLNPEG